MEDYLVNLARDYLKTIELLESGGLGPEERRYLEGQRGVLHEQFMEALEQAGYPLRDRQHAVAVAWRFVWLSRLEGRHE